MEHLCESPVISSLSLLSGLPCDFRTSVLEASGLLLSSKLSSLLKSPPGGVWVEACLASPIDPLPSAFCLPESVEISLAN